MFDGYLNGRQILKTKKQYLSAKRATFNVSNALI